jgi:WD40 repeat protein
LLIRSGIAGPDNLCKPIPETTVGRRICSQGATVNIFISYSSKSRYLVDVIAADLATLGHILWFDRELAGGHEWWADILQNIRNCDLFMFALTPDSLDSYPCKLEYEYASALHKRILPVMLADVNVHRLPYLLQKLHFVDYRQQNKQQALILSKALGNLPVGQPLPNPLPGEPDVPVNAVSPLDRFRNRIRSIWISEAEQRMLISDLKEYLEDDETADEAQLMLQNLQRRNNLITRISIRIYNILPISRQSLKSADYQKVRQQLHVFDGHSDTVSSVAFSPDGNYILTGSKDETAQIWHVDTGKSLQVFRGHRSGIEAVAFAADGQTVVTSSMDNTARLWAVNDAQMIRQFTGHTDCVQSVVISPNSKYVLTASWDKTARLWDVATGRELKRFVGHRNWVFSAAFSPDSKYVLTASWDKTARLWDVATGQVIQEFAGHTSYVREGVFSPDGSHILTGSADKTAKLWNISTGKAIQQYIGHKKTVRVAFAPDGNHVITGSEDRSVRLWDTNTGEEIRRFVGHSKPVRDVAVSPNCRLLLTGSADGTARLWESGL